MAGKVQVYGDSGSVTLQPPNNGVDAIITLPGSTGTVALTTDIGLAFITSSTFSAVSSVSVNNCFTSNHSNYRVVVDLTANSAGSAAAVRLRLRASSSDNSSNNYYYNGLDMGTSSALIGSSSVIRSNGLISSFAIIPTNTAPGFAAFDIFNPQLAVKTGLLSTGVSVDATDVRYWTLGGLMSVTTAYDGFTLLPDSGTITGTVRVYGYRNS